MIIISAMSENRVIGAGDGMPWNVPEEYAQYLRFVDGNTVIMGRKTFDIFGSDLPRGTTSIVVSRRASYANSRVANSVHDAVSIAATIAKPVFIAGGGFVYEQAIPLVDEMYLSTIKGKYQGEVLFPDFDPAPWKIVDERDEPRFVFRKYRRRVSVENTSASDHP